MLTEITALDEVKFYITFNDDEWFIDSDNNPLSNKTISGKLKENSIKEYEEKIAEYLATSVETLIGVNIVGTFASNAFLKGSMHSFWSMVNCL